MFVQFANLEPSNITHPELSVFERVKRDMDIMCARPLCQCKKLRWNMFSFVMVQIFTVIFALKLSSVFHERVPQESASAQESDSDPLQVLQQRRIALACVWFSHPENNNQTGFHNEICFRKQYIVCCPDAGNYLSIHYPRELVNSRDEDSPLQNMISFVHDFVCCLFLAQYEA